MAVTIGMVPDGGQIGGIYAEILELARAARGVMPSTNAGYRTDRSAADGMRTVDRAAVETLRAAVWDAYRDAFASIPYNALSAGQRKDYEYNQERAARYALDYGRDTSMGVAPEELARLVANDVNAIKAAGNRRG